MTNRERILAILDGKAPDCIPWIPRLKLWYEANRQAGTLPEEYCHCNLEEVERDVFGGTAARDGTIWRTALCGVETRTHHFSEAQTVIEYITPVGTVTTEFRRTRQSRNQCFRDIQVGFMLKRREDYPVVEYIIQHTKYVPMFEEYERYEKGVGEHGYPLVRTGDCPFHYWMQVLAGYEQAFLHLHDFPNVVEKFLGVLTDYHKQTIWCYMLDSPARLFQHGMHLSNQMTPPSLFQQYILPYYQELTPMLRAKSKIVALHGDDDTGLLLSLIEQAGFGMVECLATSPLVSTTLAQARAAWDDRVIIWGGVPSLVLEDPYTDIQFEEYMEDVFSTIVPGNAFILGIADNAMPSSKIERIRRITQMVEQQGAYSSRKFSYAGNCRAISDIDQQAWNHKE